MTNPQDKQDDDEQMLNNQPDEADEDSTDTNDTNHSEDMSDDDMSDDDMSEEDINAMRKKIAQQEKKIAKMKKLKKKAIIQKEQKKDSQPFDKESLRSLMIELREEESIKSENPDADLDVLRAVAQVKNVSLSEANKMLRSSSNLGGRDSIPNPQDESKAMQDFLKNKLGL